MRKFLTGCHLSNFEEKLWKEETEFFNQRGTVKLHLLHQKQS